MLPIILVITAVGSLCGAIISIVNFLLPEDSELLRKTEQIVDILPGMNCGACGSPGCFAYAQELAKDPTYINNHPCMTLMHDEQRLKELERRLGISVKRIEQKAIIHCSGNSRDLFEYNGVLSCKAASLLSLGQRSCAYSCLGFGDCVQVCPYDAIRIDEEKKVAVVDRDKCIGCGLCVNECPKGLIEIVPAEAFVFLACSYEARKNISGRERCDNGCIHCRKCYKVCPSNAITWDEKKDLPVIDHTMCTGCYKCVEVCPSHCMVKL